MAGFQPGVTGLGANELKQKVELRVSCKNLPNKDVTSKSDPCAVLYFKEGDKYEEVIVADIITGKTSLLVSSICVQQQL